MDYRNYCMNCMRKTDGADVCPFCGFSGAGLQRLPFLPAGVLVAERYLIGRKLGSNGDGATYIGYDTHEKSPVIIREFIPETLIGRGENLQLFPISGFTDEFNACYDDFIELWRGLAKARELSGIMSVYDIVEDYGTVFVISEYIETITLRDYLQAQPDGRLPWEEIRRLFMPILSTLEELHRMGIVHGCLSPNSLRACKDGRLRLFEFSIAEVRTTGGILPCAIPPGFAAAEQYSENDTIGPWSDVYSFCANIYRALTGIVLPEAPARANNEQLDFPESVIDNTPDYVIRALWNGLRVNARLRIKSLQNLHSQLSGVKMKIAEETTPEAKDFSKTQEEAPKKKHTGLIIFIVIFLILVVAAALGLTVFRDNVNELLGITETQLDSDEFTTTSELVDVPDFTAQNMTEEQISSDAVWNENFHIVFEYGESEKTEIGYVYDQSIEAGKIVNKGTKIVLYICSGRPQINLPDVVGMEADAAKERLVKLGFKVSTVSVENDGTGQPDVVKEINREPLQDYEYGTEIILSVWGKSSSSDTTSSTSAQE